MLELVRPIQRPTSRQEQFSDRLRHYPGWQATNTEPRYETRWRFVPSQTFLYPYSYHDELSSREYEALARDVLRDGVASEKGRTTLRRYRIANGVDSQHHMRVLRKLGWSLDDLEVGRRAANPTLDPVVQPATALDEALSFDKQLKNALAIPRAVLSGGKGGGDAPPEK